MREAQALLRRAGRTDFIMVAEVWKQVALLEELRRGEESIDLQLQARQWTVVVVRLLSAYQPRLMLHALECCGSR
jgi:hypothetical protein